MMLLMFILLVVYVFFYVYINSVYFVFFFFSSRRRHTRCLSDWSSDVCSSDLSPRRPHPSCCTSGWICHGIGLMFVCWRRAGRPWLRWRSHRPARSCGGWLHGSCWRARCAGRSEEHTSELQSLRHVVCRLLLEK